MALPRARTALKLLAGVVALCQLMGLHNYVRPAGGWRRPPQKTATGTSLRISTPTNPQASSAWPGPGAAAEQPHFLRYGLLMASLVAAVFATTATFAPVAPMARQMASPSAPCAAVTSLATPAPSLVAQATLRAGARIAIRGLASRPELNGSGGRLVDFDAAQGVVSDTGAGLLLRTTNVVASNVVAPAAGAAGSHSTAGAARSASFAGSIVGNSNLRVEAARLWAEQAELKRQQEEAARLEVVWLPWAVMMSSQASCVAFA